MTCICQNCGMDYHMDVMVPADVWEKIKPEGSQEGGGLLCGSCICTRIEELLGYSAWELCDLDQRLNDELAGIADDFLEGMGETIG